jgi:hypothetical protein
MRPLPQIRQTKRFVETHWSAQLEFLLTMVLLATGAWTLGCGGGGAGSVALPPPPPSITVSITPASRSVLLGETVSFSATVSNTADNSVIWSVNGVVGGTSQVGTISADGLYTAPGDLPTGTVQVTATSHTDSSKSATATVTVTSDISISLSLTSANVELGATQSFQATTRSQGKPDPSVRWNLSGPSCPNSCGAVDSNGNYTAPQILPSPATAVLTATSMADPSKQASANLTITSHFTLQLSAPTSVQTGTQASLIATLAPVPGSNPSLSLSWTVQGTGCTGTACGTLTITATQAAGGVPIADTATYTAPSVPPQPATVLITVTPQADPTKAVQASVTILASSSIILTPPTATLAANHRVTLTASQGSSSGNSFNWSVNGIAGGDATLGQICVTGSNPCQPFSTGSATQVDYIAPGSIPSPNPVSVTVSSTSNLSLSASAQITILNHVVVSVLPNNVTVAPLAMQPFTASVVGTTNQNVTWQIQGSACVTADVCGSVDISGTYTAPSAAPSPDALQVVAVSQDDPTQSGLANVTLSSGPHILSLHPASVYAGGADGFTLQIDGSGFVASSPGPGSTLLIRGTARVTSCSSANACTAPVTSSDVAQPTNLTVQLQNPDGTTSNAVSLVVAAPNVSDGSVALNSSAPQATGQNITVVEPTTAGIDSPGYDLDLAVAAMGTFNISTSSCNLAGNPIPLTPPSSGSSAVDICVFSEAGLDTSMTYTVSGPGDVVVISTQPAGLGIIHLTLQLPSTAAAGARTLFIHNSNLDRTAATGVLEIQ